MFIAMTHTSSTFTRLVITSALSAVALLASGVHAQTTQSGGLLRDKAGRTLYVFDKDAAGESRCYDACATAWPPFLAADGAKAHNGLTLVSRKDGALQWAFGSKPLYTFVGDAQKGDVNGDGSGGVWHVIKVDGAQAAARQPSADSNSYSYGYSN
jgi:predicted lipoprotein with Yx(FWY)xxD motif